MKQQILILALLLFVTGVGATTTTTINVLAPPVNTLNESATPGISNVSSQSISMPVFPYILVFVIAGIVAMKTRRGDYAGFAGTIASSLLYMVYNYWLNLSILGLAALAGVLALLTLLAVWEMQIRDKKQKVEGSG
jgi:uncharacterized membrane protein YdjX (TVP38/TMEM64 family)